MEANVEEAVTFRGRDFPIAGFVAPGFEPVAEAFKSNFRAGREIGAACAAFLGDRCVVDLWGGFRTPDFTAAWDRDTMVLLMSTTKGLAALAIAVAHSRGWLDFDAPVARYWPEFAQHGKGRITVRQLVAFQSGLCVFDTPLTLELLGDLEALDEVLARQRPVWTPGTRHGYSPVALGLYQSALLRRVDPQGRTVGEFLKSEIADKLAAEMYVGLPDSVDDSRYAEIRGVRSFQAMREWPPALVLAILNPRSMARRMGAVTPTANYQDLNTRPYLRIEMPSVNGVAAPRALARTYAEFATGGAVLGLRPETMTELQAPGGSPSGTAMDGFYHFITAYSLGFWKPFSRWKFGTSQTAYGALGAGGSQGFADPDLGLGFAYAPNRFALGVFDDPRAAAIRTELYRCLNPHRELPSRPL
ncbi:MAG: serine hydrolase domain-containing protein [Actinoplanes sp.]